TNDKPTEAGDYTVTAASPSGAAASDAFTIAPKILAWNARGVSVNAKVYDGETGAVLSGIPGLTGIARGDEGKVTLDPILAEADFDTAAVGKNKTVTVTGYALTGEKAFNYALPAALTLKGEIKALSGSDAPLVTPDLSAPELIKLIDTPPIYKADPATDAELWNMVYALREDTAFRSLTPESSASLLFMDLELVRASDGAAYSLANGESIKVVFPYPNATIAQRSNNYHFVLLHYKASGTESIPVKAESYGIEVTLTELSPYVLAWAQIKTGGGGGGSAPVETVTPEPVAPVTVSKATLTHISGLNRVETSVAISRQGWTSAETVILAPGGQNNLIDALAVAPLAGQEKAPILLSTGSLDPGVVAEIQRLGAKKVYAVGAINQAVIDALQAVLPGVEVETLKGANRFETANLINAKLAAPQGTFVVGYNAIADAVSAASFAAANGYAIQIASPDGSVSAAPTGTAYVLGGPTLVQDVAGATRLYGATRYETNKAIRDALTFEYTNIYTADGNTLVDALTGSALAAQTKSAVVLLPGNDPTGTDFGAITTETKVYAFGG
ncbi:MAG: cell wall-binding repeat-containing protein, partial [Gracilibacteraceae bacterium]|nr:cell wall-binding repeat-containing protein [Gracilibacteraceae bacterium]